MNGALKITLAASLVAGLAACGNDDERSGPLGVLAQTAGQVVAQRRAADQPVVAPKSPQEAAAEAPAAGGEAAEAVAEAQEGAPGGVRAVPGRVSGGAQQPAVDEFGQIRLGQQVGGRAQRRQEAQAPGEGHDRRAAQAGGAAAM